jgi:hypothetical protein
VEKKEDALDNLGRKVGLEMLSFAQPCRLVLRTASAAVCLAGPTSQSWAFIRGRPIARHPISDM